MNYAIFSLLAKIKSAIFLCACSMMYAYQFAKLKSANYKKLAIHQVLILPNIPDIMEVFSLSEKVCVSDIKVSTCTHAMTIIH